MLKSATLELVQLARGCQSTVLPPAQLLRPKAVKGLFEQMCDYDQTHPPWELGALAVYPFPPITCPTLTAVTCLISIRSRGGGRGPVVGMFILVFDYCLFTEDPAVTPVLGWHCARGGQTVWLLEQQQSIEAIHDQDMLTQRSFTSHRRVIIEEFDLIKRVRGQFPEEVMIELSSQIRGNERKSRNTLGGANRRKGLALTLRTVDTSAVF